jgi:hypothetical protein
MSTSWSKTVRGLQTAAARDTPRSSMTQRSWLLQPDNWQSEGYLPAILRLCSLGARFVVGAALPVDGGFTAH